MPNQTYFLGIDGGGSKCKARLEDAQGNLLAESIAGPANPVRDRQLALSSIQQASQEAIELAGLPASTLAQTYAGIGLAGLNLPYYKNTMQEWQHPFAGLALSTDLHIACLGAHNSDSGAIVIVGTGSSAIVCKDAEQFEYGGHGFLLGDKGSGAWFGLQTVRWALESFDGIKPSSPFIEAVCRFFGCTDAAPLVEKHLASSPAEFAKLAPLVFEYAEQQDPVAAAIVQEGAAYLSALAQQLLSHKPQRLAFIGGLAHKIQPWLDEDIQHSLRAPFQSPESGAIILARKQFQVLEKAL
ncbi:BadF/BadG/BcrA/BcrD ATPase family protein [Aliiglaciecola lipolytica]|uniref:BadF/BadG/BcrA/BcrD ATPase family protein n=1 Tax=Aliiglaciecola lipolytica E3 TaxID=1127673 RepID=K6XY60_9ALTE|nr:BadF/BadG/BcrA/BcrD ATPase family protein [Aliiglaciecola lipolytica]GAC16596.1 BadF/BadG/BcrA/BcrD ATPase family protein [Aliiglaciecola lipolytica E3]